MDFRGLRVTKDAYFSLLIHTKQLSLVTFYDTTTGIGSMMIQTGGDGMQKGNTDMKFEIVVRCTYLNGVVRHAQIRINPIETIL